jgi:hypothetical protein
MKIPTHREREMSRYVLDMGGKIAQAARVFAVSPSTIRRAMDKVTEFEHSNFNINVTGKELTEIIGWLNNGNTTSAALVDKIVADVEGS